MRRILQFFRVNTAALCLVSAALAAPIMSPSPALAAIALDAEESSFCGLINNYRASKGLPALLVSPTLTNASEWHSNEMAAKNYFSHTDSLGRTSSQRMAAFGYNFSTYRGENIAAGSSTATATFDQWKNSSGHNANMLNADYKVIGIGKGSNTASTYRHYWTTDFGGYVETGAVPCPGSNTPPPTPPPPSGPGVSVTDVSIYEGNASLLSATKTMQFRVRIPSTHTQPVSVRYSTGNGTALSGADYTATSGTLTIPAGSTSGLVSVPVVKDSVREADENLSLNISNPVNGFIADAAGVGTILNDD